MGEREMGSSGRTVVVIGAGYAGVMAANRLRSSLSPEEVSRTHVVVINRTNEFVERIRLHQVAAGTVASAGRPLRDVLYRDVGVVVGDAVSIDPERKLVEVATGTGRHVEHYDTLIYAVGSVAAMEVPGAEAFAYPVANPDGAHAAYDVIAKVEPGESVLVVGGGATGVETAAEIAEQHPEAQVALLCDGDLLGFMPSRARARISRTLLRLGVHVHEHTRVAQVLADQVELADGTHLPSDITVWAASFAVPQLAATSGLAVDDIGRLHVDEYLRSVNHPDIIGAGDAVRPPASVGAHLRMSCATALPLGGHAANTALAHLRGTPPRPLSAGYILQCLSLGRRNGYVQFVHPDDTPRPFHIAGAPAAKVKERICQLVVSGPQKERTKPGSYRAPAGPRGTKPR